MDVLFQLELLAAIPLKLTWLVPRKGPKSVPETVTDTPTAPELGESPLMVGGAGVMACKTALEVAGAYCPFGAIVAVMLSEPTGSVLVDNVAVPLLGVAVPIEVEPLRNVTAPVPPLVTVAVKVTEVR